MADVTLRPMTLGQVLDTTFSLYKRNFWLFVGITSIPFLAVLILQVGAAALQLSRPSPQPASPALASGAIVGGIVFLLAYFLLAGAAQAATIFAVSDLYLGRAATVRGSFRKVGGKAFRVILVLLLVGLTVGVGFLLLIIPGIILFCRTAVAVPASMLEDTKAVGSIERSMQLTKGFAMQIFLIFLLVWVLSYLALLIFQVPFAYLQGATAQARQTLVFGMLALQHLSSFLSNVLVGPIGTIAFSLMYYNLRVRKEAFDIQHLMNSLPASPSQGAAATT
ncbi:MAG TPA: hypothetical protein VM709_02620 [Candidatus Sulfotelmatobacter sp.]|nr:hypothetical protein [Candidatus Sulfotelmatobacter sp.]